MEPEGEQAEPENEMSDALAIARGEKPFTWDHWAKGIDEAETLTPRGQVEVHSMVDTIIECFGVGWLPRSYEKFRRAEGNLELPLLSMSWWPSNQAPHVFARLIWLGCQIRMFRRHDGFGKLRKNLQGDLSYFEHGLMQLEVAALAARAGWSVTFEPPVGPESPGRGDVLLERAGERMLVEVKGFVLDETTKADMRTADLVAQPMGMMELELQVTFRGDIEPDFPHDRVDEFVARLRGLAADAKSSGLTLMTTTPGGAPIEVHPCLLDGMSHTMPIHHGDELLRIKRAVEAKCAQGAGSVPLWLRMNETNLFWALAAPQDCPRPKLHEFLAGNLAAFMAPFPHVAGVMFSAAPGGGVLAGKPEWQNLNGRSISMFRTTIPGFCRESLLVPGPHVSSAEQMYEWRSWYSDEEGWLTWALVELGVPPLSDLIAS